MLTLRRGCIAALGARSDEHHGGGHDDTHGLGAEVRAPGRPRQVHVDGHLRPAALARMKPAFTPLRRIGPVVEGGSTPGSTSDIRRAQFSTGRRKSMMDYDKPRGANSFQTYKKISGRCGAPGAAGSGGAHRAAAGSAQAGRRRTSTKRSRRWTSASETSRRAAAAARRTRRASQSRKRADRATCARAPHSTRTGLVCTAQPSRPALLCRTLQSSPARPRPPRALVLAPVRRIANL